jgi:Zn-dependent membrane protease YugP
MRDWGGFVVLVLLGWLLRKVVGATYLRIKQRVDDAVPDHLPMGGGEWLRGIVPADVRVLVGSHADAHADAYMPGARVIILSREVYRKRDASFWAVAAHELGHAYVYRSSWIVHALLSLGRIVVAVGTALSTFLIFANVLYARPDVDALAFALLHASLLGYVVVLIDEALASVIGALVLSRDARVNRRDMVGAITRLLAAFMTYVGGFVGQVVLVLQRDFIVSQIERHRHFSPAAPMGAARIAVVIVLSALLVAWSLVVLARTLRKPHAESSTDVAKRQLSYGLHEVGRGFVGAIVVWLVWNQPYGPSMPLVCVAGLVGSRGVLRIAAGLVEVLIRVLAIIPALIVGLLLYLVYRFLLAVMDFDPPALEGDAKHSAPPPPPDSERTKTLLEALEVEQFNRPSLYTRLAMLSSPALHLAFVVGLFVVIVGSR